MSTAGASPAGAAAPAAPIARSVEAGDLLRAIQDLGITHVITVPDTHQKTLLALLAAADEPRLLTVSTEDEAIAINAGLYIGGQRPMLLIQNNGLLASLNALKAIALDARVPTLLLVGQFHRDVTRTNVDTPVRAVRLVEPTLAAWDVPCYPIEGPEDVPLLAEAYRRAQQDRGPAVALLGAPTS